MVEFDTFAARMENLNSVIPKPIVYPAGYAEFVEKKDGERDWKAGKVFFLGEGSGEALEKGASPVEVTWR